MCKNSNVFAMIDILCCHDIPSYEYIHHAVKKIDSCLAVSDYPLKLCLVRQGREKDGLEQK